MSKNFYSGISIRKRFSLYSKYKKLSKSELSLLRKYFEWDALLIDIEMSLAY